MDDYACGKYKRQFMGKIPLAMNDVHDSFDGRYLIGFSYFTITIVELFHSKLRNLFLDFSTATIEGIPLKTDKEYTEYKVKSVLLLDLSTILIVFHHFDSHTLYLGVGEINFEGLVVTVKKTVPISFDYYNMRYRWFLQSRQSNLSENVILLVKDEDYNRKYFTIKMEDGDQLRVSPFDVPAEIGVFGCFDGCLYGLAYEFNYPNGIRHQTIDLVKISLSNGQLVRQPTKIDQKPFGSPWALSDGFAEKGEISALDLETLEWKHTNIEFDGLHSFSGNGTQTLMISTPSTGPLKYNIYRFVVGQPDKLSTLAWLRLKRIFDARSSAYKFILSQLPANFKQKCPFPRSGNYNITTGKVETEKQTKERFTRLSEKTTISFELKRRSEVKK
ncbi:hypothetical protein M3Y95_00902400 [Aphelenchoides besseyi]|nr:hypothetical protein M3Y95_00902400 [Aphelenchoides besseyi]